MSPQIIHLAEVDSTNRWLRDYTQPEGEEMTVCVADYQTAGKGFGSNTWESERGKNLLFSLLIHPTEIPAQEQFHISMATALAVCQAMRDFGISDVLVKWPNDIYWHNRKLCGILIENRISGSYLRDSIIGIGLNVNQTAFPSLTRVPASAGSNPYPTNPVPVSMCQILGHDIDREQILHHIIQQIKICPCMLEYTHLCYNAQLYRRRQGLFPFCDADGEFLAELLDTDRQGNLYLRKADGTTRSYAFKEVQYLINH